MHVSSPRPSPEPTQTSIRSNHNATSDIAAGFAILALRKTEPVPALRTSNTVALVIYACKAIVAWPNKDPAKASSDLSRHVQLRQDPARSYSALNLQGTAAINEETDMLVLRTASTARLHTPTEPASAPPFLSPCDNGTEPCKPGRVCPLLPRRRRRL